jgi:hypothetical protein
MAPSRGAKIPQIKPERNGKISRGTASLWYPVDFLTGISVVSNDFKKLISPFQKPMA